MPDVPGKSPAVVGANVRRESGVEKLNSGARLYPLAGIPGVSTVTFRRDAREKRPESGQANFYIIGKSCDLRGSRRRDSNP